MQVGRKIYYELDSGNIILDTGERQGSVVETTAEQDFAMYVALQQYVQEAVGVIQLEFGKNADKFGFYNYSINKDTGSIVWGELINPDVPAPQPTLEDRLANLEAQNATLQEQNLTLMAALADMYDAIATITTTT